MGKEPHAATGDKVGLMGVKADRGGHDGGVFGVDEGVGNTSIPLWKRGRTVTSDAPTSSDFRREVNEDVGENQRWC